MRSMILDEVRVVSLYIERNIAIFQENLLSLTDYSVCRTPGHGNSDGGKYDRFV